MCGNGHKGKEWEFAWPTLNITFTSDLSYVYYGFNITVELSKSLIFSFSDIVNFYGIGR